MPNILTFSSQVVLGHVGNSAMQFALQRLGFDVFAIPTILLSYHKGYERPPFEQEIGQETISRLAADIDTQSDQSFAAVLSGYLGNAQAATAIASLVRTGKIRNDIPIYLCDPVLGDEGRLYVGEEVAAVIRDELVPTADIITPNLFELGWLAGDSITSFEQSVQAARSLKPARVLVTSAPAAEPDETATLLATPSHVMRARTKKLANPPHGAGDLIAALFLARILQGYEDEAALRLSVASVHDVLQKSADLNIDELALIAAQEGLVSPQTEVICEIHAG